MCKSVNNELKRNRKMYSLRKRCDMSVFFIRDVEQNEEQIANLTMAELFEINIHKMRKSFFKYFPNTTKRINKVNRNFSLEALENNTVFLSAPSSFDDPYDCNLFIDANDFALQRIRYYAELCGVDVNPEWNYEEVSMQLAEKIYTHSVSGKPLDEFYKHRQDCEMIRLHHEAFFLRLQLALSSPETNGESYSVAFNKAIKEEYDEIQNTANRFRVACFAETPYSMLMWSHYANYHQGFCIEYETPDYSSDNAEIYHNLFPVIYTDKRTILTSLSLNWRSNGKLSSEELWDFYKYGLLSKSQDWKYQQEWRLISCDNLITDDTYNCHFFKIKKVYLGNRMSAKDRKKIIKICKSKGIPYVGVIISPDKFEMKDCNILCENCQRIKQCKKRSTSK